MSATIKRETALLFDLDGTLLDTAPDLVAAVNHARKELLSLPPLPIDMLRPVVAAGTQAMVFIGTNQTSDSRLADDFRHSMLEFYAGHIAVETRPFDGIDDLLDYLDAENRPWGIVTNKLSHFAGPILDQLALTPRAACLICADMAAQPKPAPDTLLLAARELKLAPHYCAYVGDAATDMAAARNAGMLAIAAEWGYLSADDPIENWSYDLRCRTPRELLRWTSQ